MSFRVAGREPDALPGFVGFEEAGSVVVAEAFGERAVGPVEGHERSSIPVRKGACG